MQHESLSLKHAEFQVNLQRLQEQLKGREPYFTGDNLSLVDSTYALLFMRMQYLNRYISLYQEPRFPRITAWAGVLLQLDSVKQSVPRDFNDIYACFYSAT